MQSWSITTDFIVEQTYTITSEWYFNIAKTWYNIKKIQISWSFNISWSSQLYVRLNDYEWDNSMYWYVFDYVNSSRRRELQLRTWNSRSNQHLWNNYWLNNWTNSFNAIFEKSSIWWTMTLNWVSSSFSYNSNEQSRINSIFSSNTAVVYIWKYNASYINFSSISVYVLYERV